MDDLGGYTGKELYVERAFADYKAEILSHIDIEEYQRIQQEKVQLLMTTNKVREMRDNQQRALRRWRLATSETDLGRIPLGLTRHRIGCVALRDSYGLLRSRNRPVSKTEIDNDFRVRFILARGRLRRTLIGFRHFVLPCCQILA